MASADALNAQISKLGKSQTKPVYQFDPKKVNLTVGGYIMGGFDESSFIDVSRDEDGWIKKVGCSGEVARYKNSNRAGSVKIRIMQSSPSNDALSLLATLDEFGGFGAVPILARDQSGRSLFASPLAWVRKYPNVVWQKDVAAWEWVIDTVTLTFYLGGN